jgi:mono/diheme cytochrome c family protein
MDNLRLRKPPTWMVYLMLIAIVATFVPIAAIARSRLSTSPDPRIHLVQDMGSQPRYGPQQVSSVFADRRAARPTIDGTVSRHAVVGDDHFLAGFSAGPEGKANFFEGYPKQIKVEQALLTRGQNRFAIYCTPCHGQDGRGEGMVHLRASEIQEPKWVKPADLTSDTVRNRPEGHLFNTITNGIRNMGGLGGQISIEDRWAIVSYVRALQLAQGAPASALTPEQRNNIK